MKIVLSLIIMLIFTGVVLADDESLRPELNNAVQQLESNWNSMTPYQRGDQEQEIARLVLLPKDYIGTMFRYHYLYTDTAYFSECPEERRDRMWNYILERQRWDTHDMQVLANNFYIEGYHFEARLLFNHNLDRLQPINPNLEPEDTLELE